MKNCTDLNLGEDVYMLIIYHIPDSSFNLLNGYDIYFWWRACKPAIALDCKFQAPNSIESQLTVN